MEQLKVCNSIFFRHGSPRWALKAIHGVPLNDTFSGCFCCFSPWDQELCPEGCREPNFLQLLFNKSANNITRPHSYSRRLPNRAATTACSQGEKSLGYTLQEAFNDQCNWAMELIPRKDDKGATLADIL